MKESAHDAVAAAVRVRERLAPDVHLWRTLNALSPRQSTAPPHCRPTVRRLRLALCRGCAAALSPMPVIEPFLFLQQDDRLPQVPVMLPTIISVPPIPFLFLGASLRDRAGLRSPQAVSALRAAIPRPSVRFADCASLARRFAALTADCLTATPGPGVDTVAIPPPESISLALRAQLVSRCTVAHRLGSPAFAVANADWLPSRLLASAHAPRRLPFGSVSGTSFPVVRYPGSGLSHSIRCSAFTRRTSDARCTATSPGLPLTALEPTIDVSCMTNRRPLPKKPLRIERVLQSIAIRCIDLTGLVWGSDALEHRVNGGGILQGTVETP